MPRTLYLDCSSGISGDMVVGALLDAGAREEGLRTALASLGVDGFEIRVSRRNVSSLDVCDFDVVLDAEHDGHDHDMDWLYGDLDGHDGHDHHHGDRDHGHHHGHGHGDHHHHVHVDDHHHEHENGDHHHHAHDDGCGHGHDHHGHDHEHGHGHDHHDPRHENGDHHHHAHDDGCGHGHDHHGHDHEHGHGHDHHEHVNEHDHERGYGHHHGDHDHEHNNENAHHKHGNGHDHGHHHGDHDHEHEHDHVHACDAGHGHDHTHAHHHHTGHGHHHEHRGPADIAAIIDAADLSHRTREIAHRIFDIVAAAESKAHGVPVSEVHFHEVGAVDSIVDVVAAAWCLDDLGVDEVVVSPLAEGHGRVRSAHGVLPIPVPAVTHIVEAEGLVLERKDIAGELVTPTGAAIAAAFRTTDAMPERYRIVASGTGSGKRTYDPPSTVRALVVESVDDVAPQPTRAADDLAHPHLWKLETEMDDCSGEALAHALTRLYEAGALEAHYLPTLMKKGRPGYQVEVLCSERSIPELERVLFEDTTTIGIRRSPLWRTALPREFDRVETPYGDVQVKVVTLPDGRRRAYPEYDWVARRAKEAEVALQEVLRATVAACTIFEATA